jgi:hypothetical protein
MRCTILWRGTQGRQGRAGLPLMLDLLELVVQRLAVAQLQPHE